MKKFTLFFSALLFSMMSFAGVVTFNPLQDKGNAGTDSNNATAFEIAKSGVTLACSQGVVSSQGDQYRFFKNQTVTITSTVGNITSVEFTCTANGDTKHGPGGFTVTEGTYGHDGGKIGTWTGSAAEVVFTASVNQVRATQVVVTIDGEGAETPDQPEEPETPETPENPGTTTIEIPAEAQAWNIPAEAIDVLQAREICAGLASGETTGTKYYVMGYVKKLHKNHESGITGYGNATFYMENVSGADSQDDFLAFQVYGPNGEKITDPNVVAVGDFVVVYGELTNYMGSTYETVGKGAAYIWNSTNPLLAGGETPDQPEEPETPDTPVTPETPEGAIVFDAGVDQGNATTDYNLAGPFQVTKSGVTLDVTKGCIGVYNSVNHYRIYKNETLTLTSTVGNIVKVEFTCTANGEEKYGPGCFTVDGGDYTYADAVGTWTGSAAEITFSAAANQVRATQIVVTIEGGTTPTDVVNVKDLAYANAYYMEEEGIAYWDIMMFNVDETGEYYEMPIVFLGVEAKSKTALNGTYDLLLALYGETINEETYEVDGVYNDETIAATLTIKNVNNEGDYSFVGSFVGEDGKTYKINTVANVYAEDDATEEVIELKEEGTDEPGDDPVTPPTPPTTDGAVTFDADVDQGNASLDSNNTAPYTISKDGITMDVTDGIIGVYNNEAHYRIYKNQTLTLTSTVGKIVKVEFTCTANGDAKYGPGCFTVDGGDYTYADAVGTWTGSADAIVFTASTNQVRATQVVVTLASTGTGVEDVVTVEVPVKVIENGQLMIIRGENVYNVLGAQVK